MTQPDDLLEPSSDRPADEESPDGSASPGPLHRLWLHLMLFLATCATTFFAGAQFGATAGEAYSLRAGMMFSGAIMSILLVHEMGHFFAARLHGVAASLPFFIPVPFPPIGTLGAVIRMPRPPRSRSALLDIGYAGPLAGLIVALGVCLVGLRLSEVHPITSMGEETWVEGNSLLYLLLKWLVHPEMKPHEDVFLHPLAWAGWLGLLVTSMNLLPIGQLDGGHVLYALWGPAVHRRVARIVRGVVWLMGATGIACQVLVLVPGLRAGVEQSPLLPWILRGTGMVPWVFWALILQWIRIDHPPVNEETAIPLSPTRRTLAIITLAVLVLTITPSLGRPLTP